LNDEPPNLSPSDLSNDTSKHDDSSEERKDDLRNKRLGVSSKDIHNKKIKKIKKIHIPYFLIFLQVLLQY
jgi:hypothetical protein